VVHSTIFPILDTVSTPQRAVDACVVSIYCAMIKGDISREGASTLMRNIPNFLDDAIADKDLRDGAKQYYGELVKGITDDPLEM
jgi:hypothetical protein